MFEHSAEQTFSLGASPGRFGDVRGCDRHSQQARGLALSGTSALRQTVRAAELPPLGRFTTGVNASADVRFALARAATSGADSGVVCCGAGAVFGNYPDSPETDGPRSARCAGSKGIMLTAAVWSPLP